MKPAIVVGLLVCLPGCIDAPTTGEAMPPLVGGKPDATHRYAVGICYSPTGDCRDSSTARCTGSLVASDVVLTARQCIDQGVTYGATFCDAQPGLAINPLHYFVTTHEDPYGAGARPIWYAVKSVMPMPKVTPIDTPLCSKDLALLWLMQRVPSSEAQPIELDLERELAPTEVAIVGRGAVAAQLVQRDGTTGVQVTDDGGKRRRSLEHVPVLCLPDKPGGCVQPDDSVPAGTFTAHPNQLVVGGAGLPGDLGAGIVDQSSFAGVPVLLGAVSGSTWDGGQVISTFGMHVSAHRDFIASTMAAVAALHDEPGGCSTTRTGSPLPVAALLWLLRRRRRTVRRD